MALLDKYYYFFCPDVYNIICFSAIYFYMTWRGNYSADFHKIWQVGISVCTILMAFAHNKFELGLSTWQRDAPFEIRLKHRQFAAWTTCRSDADDVTYLLAGPLLADNTIQEHRILSVFTVFEWRFVLFVDAAQLCALRLQVWCHVNVIVIVVVIVVLCQHASIHHIIRVSKILDKLKSCFQVFNQSRNVQPKVASDISVLKLSKQISDILW